MATTIKKRVLSNLTSNYLLSFVGMALGFFLIPFLIRKLGKELYGIIVLTESTVGFFEILTVSVRIALSRHATFALSQEKMDDLVEYLSTGLRILWISMAIVLAVGGLVSYHFPSLFKVPAGYDEQSRVHFLLITAAFALSIPNIVYWSALYAKQRFDLINFSASFGLIMRAICIFAFYSLSSLERPSLTAYGFIYLTMTVAQNGMVHYWCRRIFPAVRFSLRVFKPEKVREILSFSAHMSLTRAGSLLYENTANIIINVFWGPALNAIYSVALKLPNIMSKILIEPTWSLTPTFTDLAGKGDLEKVRRFYFLFSKMLAVLAYPLLFTLMLLSHGVIRVWVGPDLALAAQLMPLYLAPLFTITPGAFSGCVFNAYAKVKLPSLVSFGMALLNIALCFVLGVFLDMKLFGIALASAFCTLATSSLVFPNYACRIMGTGAGRYYRDSMLKPLGLSVLVVVGGFAVVGLFRPLPDIGASTLLVLALLNLVYYACAYRLLLEDTEREHILSIARTALEKLGIRTAYK